MVSYMYSIIQESKFVTELDYTCLRGFLLHQYIETRNNGILYVKYNYNINIGILWINKNIHVIHFFYKFH